ncbi:MAG: hypothetical protein JO056_04925 [Alphaproteobacteria bacterium]|nr:hypothetical protein [Alphaproteobacteria bacterium]
MVELVRTARLIVRGLALASIVAVATGCSSNVDILDPDTWNSPSTDQQSTTAAGAPGTVEGSNSQGKTVAEAGGQYPAVADIPAKPSATSDDEQKKVANALVADRAQAQYSAEALQAGNEPAAAPPPPAEADAAAADAAAAAGAAEGDAQTALPPSGDAPRAEASAPMPGALPSEPAAAPTTQVASAAPPPANAPVSPPPAAAAAAKANEPAAAPAVAGDSSLGFQPSHAPPLDPYVAQMAAGSAPRGQRLASVNAVPAATPIAMPSGPPAATVTFGTNSMALDANGASQVQSALAAYRTRGGQGYVRIVGHAASGAADLPADRQMIQSLQRAQACANAVARELIRQGVPANRVLVDAAGSLAQDEQRRAEIFLQS